MARVYKINFFKLIGPTGLAQFQAKESTEIPQEVYDKIILEIKKERIKNLARLTNKKIRHSYYFVYAARN